MVHISLEFFIVNTVQHLAVFNGAESGDGENLSLTAGEHSGAMRARQ
ncbi:hypothetical protein SDC9_121302 [bioreactor metagenome]|uniref:Uncharacterized protein n=1 Tax=bioreactor metagenome TaxID=1076179 RepID=A0A645CBL2_9ZZZZ